MYVQDQMKNLAIQIHLNTQNCMKYMDKGAVFSSLVDSGVLIHWSVNDVFPRTFYLCDCDKSHGTLRKDRIVCTYFFWVGLSCDFT